MQEDKTIISSIIFCQVIITLFGFQKLNPFFHNKMMNKNIIIIIKFTKMLFTLNFADFCSQLRVLLANADLCKNKSNKVLIVNNIFNHIKSNKSVIIAEIKIRNNTTPQYNTIEQLMRVCYNKSVELNNDIINYNIGNNETILALLDVNKFTKKTLINMFSVKPSDPIFQQQLTANPYMRRSKRIAKRIAMQNSVVEFVSAIKPCGTFPDQAATPQLRRSVRLANKSK